jgi:PPP family 3-phenylpropionic acid transporter
MRHWGRIAGLQGSSYPPAYPSGFLVDRACFTINGLNDATKQERRRISIAYFLYFATLGLYLPYFPAYLRERGLSATEIGLLLSLGPLFRGILPPGFGYLADRVRGPHFWGVVTAWLMTAGIGVVMLGDGFPWLLAGMTVYFMANSATIPLLDASALNFLARTPGKFGVLRLWGSVGFILTSLGLGALYPDLPAITIAVGLLASHVVFAFYLTSARLEEAPPARPGWREVGRLLRLPALVLLLTGLFLNRVASAPFVGFYTIFVRDVGLGGEIVALTWGIAVTVEVGIMLIVDRLIDRFGAMRILAVGFLLEALRWFAYASFHSKTALLLLAPGHGIAFTLGYVATVRRAIELVPERLRATGQGLAAGATGFGQMTGLILAGYLQEHFGNQVMFQSAGVIGMLAVAIALGSRNSRKQHSI